MLNKIAIVSENIEETFAYDHLNQFFSLVLDLEA